MANGDTVNTSKWVRWIDFGTQAAEMRESRLASGEALEVTDEHLTLLGKLTFKLFPEGGDQIYFGVDGKKPYGNSSPLYDIAELLGWEVDIETGLTGSQKTTAVRLLSELPDALNQILADLQ